jgi:hypothetical protein
MFGRPPSQQSMNGPGLCQSHREKKGGTRGFGNPGIPGSLEARRRKGSYAAGGSPAVVFNRSAFSGRTGAVRRRGRISRVEIPLRRIDELRIAQSLRGDAVAHRPAWYPIVDEVVAEAEGARLGVEAVVGESPAWTSIKYPG